MFFDHRFSKKNRSFLVRKEGKPFSLPVPKKRILNSFCFTVKKCENVVRQSFRNIFFIMYRYFLFYTRIFFLCIETPPPPPILMNILVDSALFFLQSVFLVCFLYIFLIIFDMVQFIQSCFFRPPFFGIFKAPYVLFPPYVFYTTVFLLFQ